MNNSLRILYNGSAVPWAEIPLVDSGQFLQSILDATGHGWRVVSYFGIPARAEIPLVCVLADKVESRLAVVRTVADDNRFPSIASLCPQVQLFEREIAEQCGLLFDDHPWFKPVRFHHPFLAGRDAWNRPAGEPLRVGVMDYFQVAGDEVHEVAVGPVHAGIIEPGHFRFQCHGEEVFHLEISLGYQHRGIEADLLGGPHPRTLQHMETAAGDTTIGHGQAHCMIMESLAGVKVPPRAEVLRGIALELERLANHTGDLGAIAGDVGYLPTASFCGRIRGDFLNMTAVLCGSRFGRGLLTPGGTIFDLTSAQRDDLLKRLADARRDLTDAVDLIWSTPSVMGRLEGTGELSQELALELGLVGPAARACGIKRDVRHDHPFGIFRMTHLPVATAFHGDVCSRTMIRWQEAQKSMDFIEEQLRQLPGGGHRTKASPCRGQHLAVALTEGWRGEICHVAITDDSGRFARYKVVDPSFHNWQGLAMALREQQISDFPLCNKSFNLSYCGFDL
ncbi:NADH-quinone oxidoreductase subunit C [Geobacter sp. AOG1]|uniref:hydrogenase large subunit n=1 Tax=Geobacter sp. AOG1 TaxID=1566346 RepID=UPI001CC7FD55|nr:NADH-quinone oxidoreductase subunit C [Geobacter sp. AOG1]GFE56666.1 hydrogenase [Geobacter sp. AOG1]